VSEDEGIQNGMEEKSKEFVEGGVDVYTQA